MCDAAIFDGHLDLALNAVTSKRDLSLSLDQLRSRQTPEAIEKVGTPTITFSELNRGNVRMVLSTLLARSKPWAASSPVSSSVIGDWPTQEMAYAVARGQLAWYELMQERGRITIITSAEQLQKHWENKAESTGVIITMEGADPIVEPEQLQHWHTLGLRTLMLAHFGRSHYAHGTPSEDPTNTRDTDGPLSDKGVALLREMAALEMPLDLTHLSDASFAQAVDVFTGSIYASHSACRALCPIPRNLSNPQIGLILERDGIIGVPLFNAFLDPTYKRPPDSCRDLVTLDTVAAHLDHICQLAGDADHAAIGSDLDGGFGREHSPGDLDSIADLSKLAEALHKRGHNDEAIGKILGENWLRFFLQRLP